MNNRETFEDIYKICIEAINNSVGMMIPDNSAPIREALHKVAIIALEKSQAELLQASEPLVTMTKKGNKLDYSIDIDKFDLMADGKHLLYTSPQAQASEPVAEPYGYLMAIDGDTVFKKQLSEIEKLVNSTMPVFTSPPNTQQKLDKAREALKPFAEFAKHYPKEKTFGLRPTSGVCYSMHSLGFEDEITVEDFHNAQQALKEIE
jgi:hypothetical protein